MHRPPATSTKLEVHRFLFTGKYRAQISPAANIIAPPHNIAARMPFRIVASFHSSRLIHIPTSAPINTDPTAGIVLSAPSGSFVEW